MKKARLIQACAEDLRCVEFCRQWWQHTRSLADAPDPKDYGIHPALADALRRQCVEVIKQKSWSDYVRLMANFFPELNPPRPGAAQPKEESE